MKVNQNFYTFLYHDVKSSQLSPESHYFDYGADEKRFYNIRNFKSTGLKTSYLLYLEIFLIYIYIHSRKIGIPYVTEFLKWCIILLEFRDIKVFDIKVLLVHSWVKGGALKSAQLYAEKIKRSEFVLLTTTYQNMTNFQSNPMRFELWKNGNPYESHAILFGVEVINCILKSQERGIDLFINHVMDFEANFKNISLSLFKKIYFILNDYYIFNSKWNLFDDLKDVPNRQLILGDRKEFLERLDELDISELYTSINVCICPSFDTFYRVKELMYDKDLRVFYNLDESNIENISINKSYNYSKTKNVLILGDIGFYKGKREIMLIVDYYRNSDNFKFHHFGARIPEINSNNYVCYGSYLTTDLAELIRNLDIDFAYLPFQCFETYSFALSDVFNLGLPLISTNIGAITERCVGRSNTILLNCNPDLKDIVFAFESMPNLNDSLINIDYSEVSPGDLIRARLRNIKI